MSRSVSLPLIFAAYLGEAWDDGGRRWRNKVLAFPPLPSLLCHCPHESLFFFSIPRARVALLLLLLLVFLALDGWLQHPSRRKEEGEQRRRAGKTIQLLPALPSFFFVSPHTAFHSPRLGTMILINNLTGKHGKPKRFAKMQSIGLLYNATCW